MFCALAETWRILVSQTHDATTDDGFAHRVASGYHGLSRERHALARRREIDEMQLAKCMKKGAGEKHYEKEIRCQDLQQLV